MKVQHPRYHDGVVGLPGRAITVTNSERSALACPRKWWFRHVERLRTDSTRPQRFGKAWHSVIEDVHRYWQTLDALYPLDAVYQCVWCGGRGVEGLPPAHIGKHKQAPLLVGDCQVCAGTGLGPIARHREMLRSAVTDDGVRLIPDEEVERDTLRLSRIFEGWMLKYGNGMPYRTLEVVAVELGLARVILNPRTGQPYQPVAYAASDGVTMRLASTAEVSGENPLDPGWSVSKVRFPWYQIGRLDCILRHRKTGVLYVGEWKTSQSPKELVRNLSVDPQTDGYCWLLDAAVASGAIQGTRVAGFLYDVVSSSFQYDPAALKSGGLSRAKNRTTPSWRYIAQVAARNEPADQYSDHIDWLGRNVDPKLYLREWGDSSDEGRERYGEEVFAFATHVAALRRQAARARDEVDLNIHFPRNAVCRQPGGFCPYRGPCLADGDEARESYTTGSGIRWDVSGA